ncbi:hypothetical protein IMZ11_40725 [Microtetraspora sp. AC03309]|uniref:alpha/beta fold hydrolase n=1 Tax=Microtetraspora sp. AC03309 TaxID=2779376 RepID=UPI001E4EDB6F|nr:hypothetical protein [Microtetraspora sp. AC03309]MCC5581946.1 hypothetical protein [Microtetraspora sp. AC03309]
MSVLMGGGVAILLADRHPHLVGRLVLVDSHLDHHTPDPTTSPWKMVGYSEEEFLEEGWEPVLESAGPHWAATMRQTLLNLRLPRTVLYPAADGPLPGAAELAGNGVRTVPIPDCGHNIMIDNVDGFATAVAAALAR